MGQEVNYSIRVEITNKKWNGLAAQYSFEELNEDIINRIINNHQIQIIQIDNYLPEDKLHLINHLFIQRPDLTFRIYHFLDDNCCDLNFLRKLKSVKRLSIDYIRNVENIDVLKELSLISLHLYVFDLKDYSIIKELSLALEELSLFNEVSSKVNYNNEWLIRYPNLKELYLGKLTKGIESIKEIKSLKKLTLRGIKVNDLSFLKESNVCDLSIHWCSMNALRTLQDNDKIESLQLWRILKLEDISFINRLSNLKILKLQDLARVKVFPSIQECPNLNLIYLDNLKGLEDIQEISNSISINELTMIGCQKLTIDDYELLFKNSNIEIIDIKGAGNKKIAQAIEKLKYNRSLK